MLFRDGAHSTTSELRHACFFQHGAKTRKSRVRNEPCRRERSRPVTRSVVGKKRRPPRRCVRPDQPPRSGSHAVLASAGASAIRAANSSGNGTRIERVRFMRRRRVASQLSRTIQCKSGFLISAPILRCIVTPGPLENALLLRESLRFSLTSPKQAKRISALDLPAGRAYLVPRTRARRSTASRRTAPFRNIVSGILQAFVSGIFNSRRPTHSAVREAAQPSFHRANIEVLELRIRALTDESLDSLNPVRLDVKAHFERMTLRSCASCCLPST